MKSERIIPAGARPVDGTELRLGRSAWTRDDYLREGRAAFDATTGERLSAGHREAVAQAFADIATPPAKLRAERDARWAAIYAEFGEPSHA